MLCCNETTVLQVDISTSKGMLQATLGPLAETPVRGPTNRPQTDTEHLAYTTKPGYRKDIKSLSSY